MQVVPLKSSSSPGQSSGRGACPTAASCGLGPSQQGLAACAAARPPTSNQLVKLRPSISILDGRSTICMPRGPRMVMQFQGRSVITEARRGAHSVPAASTVGPWDCAAPQGHAHRTVAMCWQALPQHFPSCSGMCSSVTWNGLTWRWTGWAAMLVKFQCTMLPSCGGWHHKQKGGLAVSSLARWAWFARFAHPSSDLREPCHPLCNPHKQHLHMSAPARTQPSWRSALTGMRTGLGSGNVKSLPFSLHESYCSSQRACSR